MKDIRPEIRLMFQKDLISLSQEVQKLRAQMMRLTWNFELQWNPSKGMEYTESFEQFGWWNNSADVHAAELQHDLEQMAKIADPENPDKL